MHAHNLALKSQLDTRELMILDHELRGQEKSILIGYVLWYFLGIFGGHRFYTGRTGTAITMLVLSFTLVGVVISLIWMIVDAFTLHQWIKDDNAEAESRILHHLLEARHFNAAMSRPV